jgi:NAD(P)-dependent dehydrogenase (short-subunit alcohol dehydrogenase family)
MVDGTPIGLMLRKEPKSLYDGSWSRDDLPVEPKARSMARRTKAPVAIVTGAARGIGRAIARHLLDGGWHVGAVDLPRSGLERSYGRHGRNVVLIEGDVAAIVTIASTRALMSEPNTESYSASKGGLLALTHALAISLGREVRVNCVSPGWIVTNSHQKLRRKDHLQHPVSRVGWPQDIAEMVTFLLDGKRAGFITGANFVVDGGMTRKMIYEE